MRAKVGLTAAIEMEPDFAQALAALSHVHSREILDGWSDNVAQSLHQALEYSQRAVCADSRNPYAHYARGRALTLRGEVEAAHGAFMTSLDLSPSWAQPHEGLAKLLTGAGRPADAVVHLHQALRLSPFDPRRRVMAWEMGRALFCMGDDPGALAWLNSSESFSGTWYTHFKRAAALGNLGRIPEGRAALQAARRCMPALAPAWLEDRGRSIPAVLITQWGQARQRKGLQRLGFYD